MAKVTARISQSMRLRLKNWGEDGLNLNFLLDRQKEENLTDRMPRFLADLHWRSQKDKEREKRDSGQGWNGKTNWYR